METNTGFFQLKEFSKKVSIFVKFSQWNLRRSFQLHGCQKIASEMVYFDTAIAEYNNH